MADNPNDTKPSPLIQAVAAELSWLETQRELGARLRAENTALDEAYQAALEMDEVDA